MSVAVGAPVLADDFNAPIDALTGAWTDYSTQVAWPGTIGNGTISAHYKANGKTIIYKGRITWGSTTSVTGTQTISLPLVAASVIGTGSAFLYDSSTAANQQAGVAVYNSTSALKFYAGAGGIVTASAPFAWATSDQLQWCFIYEAA